MMMKVSCLKVSIMRPFESGVWSGFPCFLSSLSSGPFVCFFFVFGFVLSCLSSLGLSLSAFPCLCPSSLVPPPFSSGPCVLGSQPSSS